MICSNRGGSPGRRLVETHGHIGKEYFGRQAARKGIALPSHRDGFERSGIVWPPKIADLVVT